MVKGALDIVVLIRRDHAELRSVLNRVAAGGADDRWVTFSHLSDLLIRHEVAEELVVYPELLKLRGGSAVTHSRLEDQAVIERLLIALDRQEFDTHSFELPAARLGLDVLEHIGKEDAQVLPLLETKLGRRRRSALGRRFLEVEHSVPSSGASPTARRPTGATIVDRTSVISTWMRDSAAVSDLAC